MLSQRAHFEQNRSNRSLVMTVDVSPLKRCALHSISLDMLVMFIRKTVCAVISMTANKVNENFTHRSEQHGCQPSANIIANVNCEYSE